jgi:uncharacterized membrane protein YdfJ with MMPL/SSD domain
VALDSDSAPETRGIKMHNLAERCARWSAAHWKTAVVGWLVLVVALFMAGNLVGGRDLADGEGGSGESGVAERILAKAGFDDKAGESVLVSAPGHQAGDPAFRAVLADVAATLSSTRGVEAVQSPLSPAGQGSEGPGGLVSADGKAALVRFELAGNPDDAADTVEPALAAVAALRAEHRGWSLDQFGSGSADREFSQTIDNDFERAERLSVPVSLAVLILAFGALVAAAVPVVLAVTAVVGTLGLSALVSHVFPTTDTTGSVVLLIGMAVGVDYSLFYLRREREEAAAGRDQRSALLRAAATSGQAVLVSGATVVIAMAGMLLAGNAVFTSIGVGTILVVVMAVAGSLTVLPALLAKLGHRVEWGRIPLLGRRRATGGNSRLWSAVLRPVLARPALAAVAAGLLLLVLAVPTLRMRTALPTLADLPKDLPVVRAYEKIQAAFPGSPEPAAVVIQAHDVRDPAVTAAIQALGRQAVATGQMGTPLQVDVNPAATVAVVQVPLAGQGNDTAAKAALEQLREQVVPATVGRLPGTTVAVTGETAGTVDFNDQLRTRVPIVFGFVLGLAFVLLLVTFRSLVVPLKAIVLNLLSVAASYGVLVAVFQWGWGASLVGAEPGAAIASWLPLFLFVVLFGLSMDYHVFILSRVRELVDAGRPTKEAVGTAIGATAGTVTSAAAVMVAVFAIFATLRIIDVKQLGVGLAVAILLDATIIRAILLPATMALLGEWNWYLPRWLGWLDRRGRAPGASTPARPEPAPELVGAPDLIGR